MSREVLAYTIETLGKYVRNQGQSRASHPCPNDGRGFPGG